MAASGARLARLELGTPDGIAIDLSIQTRRPASFLEKRYEALLVKLAIPRIDGRLVEVFGPDGHGVYVGAGSARLSSGLGGALDLHYASCVPMLTSGGHLGLAPPLPCPSTWRPPPSTPAKPLTFYGSESGGKALGSWNGEEGIAVRYVPGAEFGIGFVLENPNGHDVVVQRIAVSRPGGALIRYTGARIQIPPSRARPGTAGELQAPYEPVRAFTPFSIRPGDWVGVGLHFRIDSCDRNAIAAPEPTYKTLTVTYLLAGKAMHHTYTGVPLRLALPDRCIG